MKNKTFLKFYLFSVIGVLLAAIYPLSMGIRVVSDMITSGVVLAENYPKYTIPYTPIAIAVFLGVLAMPLLAKFCKKYAFPAVSALSLIIFFISELLLESQVIVRDTVYSTLESWQTWMCIAPVWDSEIIDLTALEILVGDYNPAFKLHFYIIAIVLIITILNCFYGFASMIQTGNHKRLKPLVLQSVASALFLGMCIFACYTAFYRDGSLQVSPISALLMSVFFTLFGITMGIFTGSFLLGKTKILSVGIPSLTASIVTFIMYIGEMILLDGRLYRFGTGFFFRGLGALVLAPVDILIILLAGGITVLLFILLQKGKKYETI
ncbi:MAG: hypothetical protein IJW87_06080 [Clostridia bacterium]|nr:hypothetical protein [Clostridia bacterium]